MSRSHPLPSLCALVLTLAVSPAAAHEYWLAPSRYRAAAGDTVAVGAFVGTGFRGEAIPFSARRALQLTRSAARAETLLPAAVSGATAWASFAVPDDRGVLIAYQSNFATIELPAEAFDAYLKEEGLAGPLAARTRLGTAAGPGRERYARCPKTWIAGGDHRGAARAGRAAGLPLEILPLADPGAADPLPVRVLWRGRPLAGALVRAWSTPLAAGGTPVTGAARDSVPPRTEAQTDARGEARLAVTGAGEWMIATVHMVPCAEPRIADWESWWTSLTFARPASDPR